MNAIKGTYSNGQITLSEPPNWADGTPVLVEPLASAPTIGVRDEDWDNTPEGIAAWLQWYDSLEPLDMTREEEEAWQTARQQQKDFEKGKFGERGRKIERLFE